MKGIYTIVLLIISNIFMTFAWYGNLKLSEMKIITDWPLILIILCSWGLAFFEYSFMIPANRIGSEINGGPFSLVQLKVIQEVTQDCFRSAHAEYQAAAPSRALLPAWCGRTPPAARVPSRPLP